MKVQIETSQSVPGVVCGNEMKSGDYGIVLSDDAREGAGVGHIVYCHSVGDTYHRILDLTSPPVFWATGKDLKVQLVDLAERITITRTE